MYTRTVYGYLPETTLPLKTAVMDKELIMNNFLAATQIEDLGTALSILEEHNWDLGVSKLFLVLSAS